MLHDFSTNESTVCVIHFDHKYVAIYHDSDEKYYWDIQEFRDDEDLLTNILTFCVRQMIPIIHGED